MRSAWGPVAAGDDYHCGDMRVQQMRDKHDARVAAAEAQNDALDNARANHAANLSSPRKKRQQCQQFRSFGTRSYDVLASQQEPRVHGHTAMYVLTKSTVPSRKPFGIMPCRSTGYVRDL